MKKILYSEDGEEAYEIHHNCFKILKHPYYVEVSVEIPLGYLEAFINKKETKRGKNDLRD